MTKLHTRRLWIYTYTYIYIFLTNLDMCIWLHELIKQIKKFLQFIYFIYIFCFTTFDFFYIAYICIYMHAHIFSFVNNSICFRFYIFLGFIIRPLFAFIDPLNISARLLALFGPFLSSGHNTQQFSSNSFFSSSE